jgi:hypothetical protein
MPNAYWDGSILNIKDKEKIERLTCWWHLAYKLKFERSFLEFLLDLPLTKKDKETLLNLRFEDSKNKLYGLGNKKSEKIPYEVQLRKHFEYLFKK